MHIEGIIRKLSLQGNLCIAERCLYLWHPNPRGWQMTRPLLRSCPAVMAAWFFWYWVTRLAGGVAVTHLIRVSTAAHPE